MKLKFGALLLLACLILGCLAGCNQEPGDTVPPTTEPTAPVEQLTTVVTEDTIGQLEQYTGLKKLDLTGSTCYAAIMDYMNAHPEVAVTYTVALGDTVLNNRTTAVTLSEGRYDYAALLDNLKYLPDMSTVTMLTTQRTADEIAALRAAYPDVTFHYTVMVAGSEVNAAVTELDLSGLSSDQVADTAGKLPLLEKLTAVELMNADGSSGLSIADVKALQAAAPNAVFHYSFDLFGKTVSTTDETIEYVNVNIGNQGEQTLRDALDILKGCTYFKLDECGLDYEVLASIRDDYPATKIVWRVWVWQRSWLTDTEVLRAVYHVDDTNSGPFKYLTEVKYMDLGHNEQMSDISFVSYMPNLEMAILSGAEITDLTPLAACKKLEFLEIAWCTWLEDVSPLAQCASLKYLNVGQTRVKDLSVLKDLSLELLSYVGSGSRADWTEEKWAQVQSDHPDCWITYSPLYDRDATPYSKGWRYNEDNTYTDCYAKIRQVFDYDAIDKELAGNGNSDEPTGNAAVQEVTMVVTSDTISKLEDYPNLKKADLTGSTCYEAIGRYMANHPDVTVIYTVSLGSTTVKNDVSTLSLEQGSYDYGAVQQNLKYLPSLKNVTFPATELTSEQIMALRSSYPHLSVHYTMKTQGTALSADISAVDLSAMTPDQVTQYAQELKNYPNILWVELMDANFQSKLSVADVKTLRNAAPNVIFHYSFDLFGKTVSTTDQKIEFVNVPIGNSGEQTIRDALDILSGCTYFKLDECGIDYEILAGIRDDYPNTEVVWRIWVWKRSWLTDTEVLRAVYHVDDSNSGPFKYLTKVKYMDLGHNTEMVDISFISYMPDLELAILSGSPIEDLSPLSNCKKLEFLEIAWCGWVRDVSPLAECDSLKFLNLGHTRVADLSPLKDLNLELLSYVNSGNRVGFTEADWAEIQAQHPECWITYNPLHDNDATPYSKGWRYKQEGGYTDCYRKVRDVFNLDYIDQLIANGEK